MPTITTTQEVEAVGLRFEASRGKLARPYLKNKMQTKGPGEHSSNDGRKPPAQEWWEQLLLE
jgi:hypothetical protein